MLEYMDGEEVALGATFGAWALVFFAFAVWDAITQAWQAHRKVKCPHCTSEATLRRQFGNTTYVDCQECGRKHSRHVDEATWLLH